MKKKPICLVVIILLVFATHSFAQTETEGHYFTSFDTTKIYYEVTGTGYPVVLVHGFSGTGQGWKNCAVYNDLFNAGYQVIILDQR
ncbi:MAG: alpha/beta hydrolase, partial [Bacteroidota bacterium]|nr:alpha/beta hydrolase [Bacteroidota bacterium]